MTEDHDPMDDLRAAWSHIKLWTRRVLRIALFIVALITLFSGLSDFTSDKGGPLEIVAGIHIGGAILVGAGLCSLAILVSARGRDDDNRT